jgi:anti-anti-sigma regulatory factor
VWNENRNLTEHPQQVALGLGDIMPTTPSRTPEGSPNRCPLCDKRIVLEASFPPGDATCPHCGYLLWFDPGLDESFYAGVTIVRIKDGGTIRESLGSLMGGCGRDLFCSPSCYSPEKAPTGGTVEKVLLNLENVEFLPSHMIGGIIRLAKECKRNQIWLKLCSIPPQVMEVMKLMNLQKMLDIHADEEEALLSFRQGQ